MLNLCLLTHVSLLQCIFQHGYFLQVNSSLCPRTTSIWNPFPTPFPGGGTQFLPKDHFSRDSDWWFHQIYSDKGVFDHSYCTGKDIKWCYFKASVHFENWALLQPLVRGQAVRVKSIWSDFVSLPQSGPSFHVFIKLISLCQRSKFHWEKYAPINK